jgi:hypothetical protein
MSNKVYRVSETQFKNVMETLKKEREITETPEPTINEASDDNRIFEAEFGYMEIDVTDLGDFKKHIFGTIPQNYDVDIRYNKAKVRYSISLEYRSYGIKNIYVNPESVYLSGELTVDSENDSIVKDFEIEYTRAGLQTNTLSGNMDLEGNNITIGDLPKEAEFDAKDLGHSHGAYVTALGVEQSVRNFKFTFEY